MFEKDFIRWIEQQNNHGTHRTIIGVGDDACLLRPAAQGQVVTTDTLCDGVHFDTSIHSLEGIGRKALAVSISDVLAMGAKPEHALLNFFLPKTLSMEQAIQIYRGAQELAENHKIEIVGGDTNRYDGPLIVGATVIGEVEPRRAWRIDQAQVGDAILVTGEFGGSILGKHFEFEPRTDWVQEVAGKFSIRCGTDVTDSLSLDLDYLLSQSGVGARLERLSIPISAAAFDVATESGRSPFDHAMTDGEDFELLMTTSVVEADKLIASYPNVVTKIGEVVEEPGIAIVDGESSVSFQPSGYIH